jgi:hypothetical protein
VGYSEFGWIFVQFTQVGFAALVLDIFFLPFGRKILNRLGNLSFLNILVDSFVDWFHVSLPTSL